MRRWVIGLKGDINPLLSKFYTIKDANKQSGGLASQEQVQSWWKEASQQRAAVGEPDWLGWRPERHGPQNLRDYLLSEGVPERALAKDGRDRLEPDLEAHVHQWALGLAREGYSTHDIAKLSGGLMSQTTVHRLSQRVPLRRPAVEVPAGATEWRRAESGGPRTWKDYMLGEGVPEDAFTMDRRGYLVVPEIRESLRLWVIGLGREVDESRRGRRYGSNTAAAMSGLGIRPATVRNWWQESSRQRQEAGVPAEVLPEWWWPEHPGDTVREHLVRQGVREDSLAVNGNGVLPKPIREQVWRWVTALGQQVDEATGRRRYSADKVAEMTGLLVGSTVRSWWRKVSQEQPMGVVEHQLKPDPEMEKAFPWRDGADPAGRVYAPFADENGAVHPTVRANADHVRAEGFAHSLKWLKDIARDPDDPRLPVAMANDMERLWSLLEQDVAAEVRRTIKGEDPPFARIKPALLEARHLRDHEKILEGQWGLFLTTRPAETPADQRMSLSNGRILGLYLGAVLENEEEVESFSQTYTRFPDFAMDVPNKNGPLFTMAGEAVTNYTAFANTATRPNTAEPQLDHSVINAEFVAFAVRMPTNKGRWRWQGIVALVALDNAFDPIANPHGMIIANYGDTYLPLLA
ncbi:hypothetical protein SACE_5482 [Saccharopolyspora erythraea NRRL 2338]|uniref:Uncharacterized protein n=1 Tax=Saccharopolyspora erythraea (strain ATCC 11635 / DSM 40517 / JCM 4748 / NBRC 13426 / NCIMB 8594 / NRRL 2338) TaxID=405948 RepID=A4FKX5_SACEN|nr:hypothetical protein SACE_5482 [Saccharopolyspora erythraea NRRL 2338]